MEPDSSSDVFINNSANNSASLDQDAYVSSLHVGSGSGSNGELNLIDAGRISTAGAINIGTDGGTVTVTNDYYTGFSGDSFDLGTRGGTGELIIETISPGGTNINANNISIGTDGGSGKLIISNAYNVNINSGGSFNIGKGAGSTGIVEITASRDSSSLSGDLSSSTDKRINIGKDGGNGTLNADGIVFGDGTGSIVFNHTDTNYQFDKPISREGAFDVYAGTTWIGRDNRVGFSHERDAYNPDAGSYIVVDETFSDGFSGFTRLRGGTLGLTNDGALGTSIIQGLADSTLIYGTDPVSGGGVNIVNAMEIYDGVELALQTDASIETTQAGVISGTGNFRKTGAGTLNLTANNTLTGQVTVSEGVLALTGEGEASQAARVVADATFDISSATDGASIRSLAGSGSVTLGAETLAITAAADTFSGVISGPGNLAVTGGTQTLTGDNTLTGQVAIIGGALALSGSGEVSQAARVIADGTFDISNATDGTSIRSLAGNGLGAENLTLTAADDLFSGVISGLGGLNLTAGTETLTGANTYSGETSISGGTLRAGATDTFSPNSVHNVLAGGVLDMAGYNQTIAGMGNAGAVLMNGAPGTVLTVAGDYVGNGGSIYINTTLGYDNSATDRLVVDGGRASGTTTLMITNVLGNGALTTGNGIPVVVTTNGGSAADATFIQGTRLAAGAYEYTLSQNGIGADSADGNWYLRNTREDSIIPPGPGTDPEEPTIPTLPSEPDYRVEVPLAASLPPIALEYGYSMLGTMHERIGENYDRVTATPPVYEDRVIIGKEGKKTLVRFPSKQRSEPSQFFNGA